MPSSQLQHASHIWFVTPEAIRNEGVLEYYRSILSPRERHQQQRLHFAEDRHHYLVAHALLRCALSKYLAVEPAAWQFEYHAHGKPEIANPIELPLRFNLTHTPGLVACIVSLESDCGIDAEKITTRRNPAGVARRMFSEDEQHALSQLEGRAQLEYFFERWTLREAYVKARGIGISFPLRQLYFDVASGDDIRIGFQPGIDDRAGDWQFRLLRPTEQHVLAIALHSGRASARNIVMRNLELH